MNWEQIEGNWNHFKGNVKQQWGKLTDNHLDLIAGKRNALVSKIHEIYGTTKDDVEIELCKWQAIQNEGSCSSKKITSFPSKDTKSH